MWRKCCIVRSCFLLRRTPTTFSVFFNTRFIRRGPSHCRISCIFQIASRASRDVQIDRSVWKAHESMPLKNVYLLFANLRCIRLFVIAGDRLTGVISRSILYQVSSYVYTTGSSRMISNLICVCDYFILSLSLAFFHIQLACAYWETMKHWYCPREKRFLAHPVSRVYCSDR